MTHMCSIRCKFGSPGSVFSSRPAHSLSRSARRALDRTAPCAAAPAGTGCSSHARLAAARIPALARQACLHRARRRPRALAQDRPACTVRGGAGRRRTRTRHREHLTPARLRAGSSRHRIRSPAPHKSPAEQKVAGTARHRCPEQPGLRVLSEPDGIVSQGQWKTCFEPDGQNRADFLFSLRFC